MVIESGIFHYIYHIECAFNLHSIINSGLIPGGQDLSRRQTVLFLPIDPRDKDHEDPEYIDFSVPRRAKYVHSAWKKHQDAIYRFDINLSIQKGLTLYQTRSNAIILQGTLPAYCIPKVERLKTGEVLNERPYLSPRPPPKISSRHDHDWTRGATTGVAVGGLGLRTAVTVALPAFVASRILSHPLVVTMVDHLCAAIGASRQTITAEYDARTDEALSRLASTLSTATALDLSAKLDEAYAECHLSWQNVLSGSEPAMQDQPLPAPRYARGITPDDGDGDEEHPHSRKRTKIQGVITACIDSGIREGLLQMHESEGSWAARMRLAELGDSSVDHTWLWRLNPLYGLILEADEYIDSVRFRLGCAGPVEPITCAACNSGILDTGAAHASCCALGEATRRHNAVSSLLHAAAQQCDHTAEMEVPGLIPGTDLRPADILTSALGNAYTALDVSICSPHASEAGADCTQSRVQAKLQHYGPHLDSLLRQNISYSPVVWSAYGRPHPDTLAVLRSLSKSIARKRNVASAEVVFHRLHSSITLEIWRRTARQVRACWPTSAPLVDLDLDA